MRSDILVVAAAVAISQVEAFWGTGHLLVSRRAQDLLQSQDYAAYEAVLDELVALQESNPELTKDEENHPMTECALFADNIKGEGYSFQSGWHFIDKPYLDEAGTTIADFPEFELDTYDVVDALTTLTEWLSNNGTYYKQSYYYQSIKQYFPDEDQARSFALRLVIHYVGDIHQPLHATSLVDSDYPKGDAGGNFEHLPSICGASNLHAVWDSVAYDYCGYPDLPLTTAAWNDLTSTDQEIAGQYKIDMNKLYDGSFLAWANESYDLAKEYTYPTVEVNEPLSDEYVAQAEQVLKTNIMYAGYRLNNLLQSIYGTNSATIQ